MPSDVCVAVYVDSPKQGNGDHMCGMDTPLDISRENSLSAVGSGAVEGQPLHSIPIPLVLWQGSWSDLDITAPKWASF